MPEPVRPFIEAGFPDTAFLDLLADSLGRAIADNGAGVLVHVSVAPDGPEVGILPLDGLAPTDLLLGALAPGHWSALGVAARGKAWPLDQPPPSTCNGDGPARAEVVVLVTRDGRVVSRVRQGDRVSTEPPESGLTLDCLKRAFELPTAPPSVPPSHLLAVVWLERVLRDGAPDRAAELLTAIEELDGPLAWERLRRLAVEGAWPELGLTPEEAAWLDDGAFSRWVVGRCRPLRVLLRELRRVLGPADARHLIRRLDRLGVGSTYPS